MSRRERRSVSLGRYRDRAPRDTSRGPRDSSRGPPGSAEDGVAEVSTRQNISNYLLTLQRLQASEDENQLLRRENDILRQRARSSRLSSSTSYKGEHSPHQHTNTTTTLGGSSTSSSCGSADCGGGGISGIGNCRNNSNNKKTNKNNNNNSSDSTTLILRDAEDDKIAADVKRNSLLFVGDEIPASSLEHAALEAQYKKLQEDFETVKEFLKHLFQHALTTSTTAANTTTTLPPPSSSSSSSSFDNTLPVKGNNKDFKNINSCSPSPSKQLERSLDDIHGQINQLKSSQDQQQVQMEQVQKALDNVLCQSSVRNDVTMRIVRQSDKMKELSRHAAFLEDQLSSASLALRQAEERSRQAFILGQDVEKFVSANGKVLRGNPKEELNKVADRLAQIGQHIPTYQCKMIALNNLVAHVTAAVGCGKSFAEGRPAADVVDCMSKLERLIGSEWHRLGRMLGLSPDALEDVGKFTNFDLTSRVEKVVTSWVKMNMNNTCPACPEMLKQGLDKMDRDALLLAEQPLCKEWQQLPPEVTTYVIAHVVDVPALVTELCGQGVVSADNRNFILALPQEHRRASRLLQSVTYMGIQALSFCCSSLERLNQGPLAARVRDFLPCGNQSQVSSPFLTLDLNNRPAKQRQGKATNLTTFRNPQKNSRNSSIASYLYPASAADHVQYSSPSASYSQSTSSRLPPTAPSQSSTLIPASTSTSSSSSGWRGSSGEKQQRKKRSRSLFTRKNKSRDPEVEDFQDRGMEESADAVFTPAAQQAYSYNYYHPAHNPNAVAASRGGGWGEGSVVHRGRRGREEPGDREADRTRSNRKSGCWEDGGGTGASDSHPWVRNPHHQHYQNRPVSRHMDMAGGPDEVSV